jgi:NTE family protein
MEIQSILPSVRTGLVLGGGGAAGLAFHAGVLLALHHDLGWDPRTADVIVGTSAGSVIGALLRSDVPAEDLAAWATDASPSDDGELFREVMEVAESEVTSAAVPTLTLPGWDTVRALWRPSQIVGAIASSVPSGVYDHSSRLSSIERLVDTWPSRPLWISAVRVGDGRTVWFGRHGELDHGVKPADAVAASCAVPVLARPVRIGAHRYIDGGVRSPTHADVLAESDLDIVVVSSPMGQLSGRHPLRRIWDRQVRREAKRLERAGIEVQVVSPDADTVKAMGHNLMDRTRAARVTTQAFLGTSPQLRASVADQLRRSTATPCVESAGRR